MVSHSILKAKKDSWANFCSSIKIGASMDVISDISDISGVPAGESFDTETQWDNRGDIGIVGSHHELAEIKS